MAGLLWAGRVRGLDLRRLGMEAVGREVGVVELAEVEAGEEEGLVLLEPGRARLIGVAAALSLRYCACQWRLTGAGSRAEPVLERARSCRRARCPRAFLPAPAAFRSNEDS